MKSENEYSAVRTEPKVEGTSVSEGASVAHASSQPAGLSALRGRDQKATNTTQRSADTTSRGVSCKLAFGIFAEDLLSSRPPSIESVWY